VTDFTRQLGREMNEDRVTDLAASTSFFTMLMLPAAVLAFVSSLGSLETFLGTGIAEDARSAALEWVSDTFGTESGPVADAVGGLFDQSNGGVATIGMLVALWALSRGFSGLVRALDQVYDIIDTRPWWLVRVTAVALGVGSIAVAGLASWLRYGLWPDLPDRWLIQQSIGPILLVMVVTWTATLFHVAPNHRTPWRYDLPGALLTSLVWLILLVGFATYVQAMTSANGVLGVTGTLLVAATLLYLLNLTLLVGAEVNEIIANRAGVVQRPVTRRTRSQP
jgi:membrane protein